MSLETWYIKNLAKRAIEGKAHPAEITRLPKFIDKTFGDGDGILEVSDVIDTVKEVGSEIVDKVGDVIDIITDWF